MHLRFLGFKTEYLRIKVLTIQSGHGRFTKTRFARIHVQQGAFV